MRPALAILAAAVLLVATGCAASGSSGTGVHPTVAAGFSPGPLVTERWQPRAHRVGTGWRVTGLPKDFQSEPAVGGHYMAWGSTSRLFVMDLDSGAIRVADDAGAYPSNQPISLIGAAQPLGDVRRLDALGTGLPSAEGQHLCDGSRDRPAASRRQAG